MSTPFLDLLKDAVTSRRRVTIRYSDKVRQLEPHAVGFDTACHGLLRGYQIDPDEGWKLMRLDKIEALTSLPDTFDGPRAQYKQGDKAMTGRIEAQL